MTDTNATFQWGGYSFSVSADPNEILDISSVKPVAPKNLRLAAYPYPHLRDDDGTVIARDFMDLPKLAFILEAMRNQSRT